jgi:hypothetical protein
MKKLIVIFALFCTSAIAQGPVAPIAQGPVVPSEEDKVKALKCGYLLNGNSMVGSTIDLTGVDLDECIRVMEAQNDRLKANRQGSQEAAGSARKANGPGR